MIFDGQLFYKSEHENQLAFLPKAIRWTEREDLNHCGKGGSTINQSTLL